MEVEKQAPRRVGSSGVQLQFLQEGMSNISYSHRSIWLTACFLLSSWLTHRKNGDLYVYPSAGFALVSPKSAQNTTSYQFGGKRLLHDFCKLCGVSTMERSVKEPGEAHGVNVRCLAGVDIWGLKRRMSDGWSIYEPQYETE